MKSRIAFAITLFTLSAGSYSNTLCQEKGQDIQKEISYAEKHNNQNRINGLNKRSANSEQTAPTVNCVLTIRKRSQNKKMRLLNVSVIWSKQNKKAMRIKLRNVNASWLKLRMT